MSLDLELLCHLYGLNPVGAEILPCIIPTQTSACWCIRPAAEKATYLLGTSIRMERQEALRAALLEQRKRLQGERKENRTKASALWDVVRHEAFDEAFELEQRSFVAAAARCTAWIDCIDRALSSLGTNSNS